ncbi:hypothetical protein FGB62_61g193 [Gracilaria domingensis]|nr:hypothetical protein FGB62_61g193 [Gracilaria domingensis]
MGGAQSAEEPSEVVYDGEHRPEDHDEESSPECRENMSGEMKALLDANTYKPGDHAEYPYFLVQLSESEELEYDGKLVSEAIVEYIQTHEVTHIFAQTHGWNTPPDKAVAVPFTEFIGGMQDDRAMPGESDSFKPIFVAFIWPAVPHGFGQTDDALTKAELLVNNERENGQDSEIAHACEAAKRAIDNEDPEDDDLKQSMRALVAQSRDDDDDDDDDPENVVEREREIAREAEYEVTSGGWAQIGDVFKVVMRPVETFVFGRLMKRGQRVGQIMGAVIGKLMKASESRKKVSLMANSLGAHVLVGLMGKPNTLPYKLHTVFFVQGAIARDYFEEGGKFSHVKEVVAGPVMVSYSEHDRMLQNIFGWFHGVAIGFSGTPVGPQIRMKGIDSLWDDPYSFECGEWNNIDGSEYVS